MKIAIITHKTKNLARTRKKLLKCFLSKQYEVVRRRIRKNGGFYNSSKK